MGMSSSLSLFLLLVPSMAITIGAVNVYKVGDNDGWRVPAGNDPHFYETWANKIKFLVGDSIVFEYRNDSVVTVSKRGYYHCNETKHASVSKDGSTVFLLDKPGFFYFASGDAERCKKGQRLMVDVVGSPASLVPAPSPPPSAAASLTVAIGTWSLSLVFLHCSSFLF
ncbi:uncharacterized protein A4U43_C01F19800 [Asparagus officinalis]|uniref:Phytocyanin domain-containing protein n=1 Tax=Asparagus officinalis TaxID=4686 RepID=A0A5P1FSG5_ASPOF|nr:mavicyanin-like [Asparagus officinalis]ONK80613.1 uncharacterized protein A4U43_C01F19800 [Asparagus officinalis]